MMDYTI